MRFNHKKTIKEKKKMSAPDSGVGALPEGHECPEGQIWDEASNGCVPVSAVSEPAAEGTGAPAVTASMGLTQRIERTVQAYFTELEKKLDKKFDEKLAQLVKTKEAEVENALRKSFGIDKDPVVHLSDLQKFSRKLQLETSESGKRSPASPGVAGPEGNTKEVLDTTTKKIDGLLKEYGMVK